MASGYYNDTNPDTWTTWMTWTSCTCNTTTSACNDAVWDTSWENWQTGNTTTSSATSSNAWYTWNATNYKPTQQVTYPSSNSWVVWVGTEEEAKEVKHQNRLARRQERAQLSRQERKRQQRLVNQQKNEELNKQRETKRQEKIKERRGKRAESKAWELLEDIVTPEETKRYRETRRLLVHGQTYDWLIRHPSYNGGKPGVVRVEKGKLTDICVHTNGGKDYEIPEADRIMSLALSAKFNEKAFNEKCHKLGTVRMPDSYFKECGNF